MTNARYWYPEEICEYYDSHPNITLQELSSVTGRTVAELKEILMSG